ncbi:DUF4335 domain-containing protein [Oscillatoria acuminata]|uniref:DUF4335 domain-containing protein n=1 Tax=Oscillatoria acuminata PCC 6304 TaxID=56110 RepID=K9TRM6_9CYAN|nr:DUF4335 domain-containing protein [Oscillatoria acuminata]AFY84781.1 hypothetical protein Oscil6304_5292 [Oscillatoria acuminata PCC 6304]
MSIQRQYSLPTCKLVLEGLTDENLSGDRQDGARPLMSILVSAECYLPPRKEPIAGGQEFFQSLVNVVSHYAQEFLSGIKRFSFHTIPVEPRDGGPTPVQLQKINPNLHRLIVQPQESYNSAPIEIELSSVQLFDLVEAVDQFCADSQTLPQIHGNLRSLSRQEAKVHEPVTKRALPATVGLSSLAVAALAFFLMPIPEYQRPLEPVPTESLEESRQGTGAIATGNGPDSSPAGSPPDPSAFGTIPVSNRQITDVSELQRLEREVYNQIDRAWRTTPTFSQPLVYQVTAGTDGAILGYKPENQAAQDYQDETPLLDLVYIPVDGGTATAEEVAVFRVVFDPPNTLQVSPSESDRPEESDRSEVPEVTPVADIQDLGVLESLQQQVYEEIDRAWTENPDFERDLIYRIWVNAQGAIVDYEATDSLAKTALNQTPLKELHQPSADYVRNTTGSDSSLAEFRVVFTAGGILQISPWKGFR